MLIPGIIPSSPAAWIYPVGEAAGWPTKTPPVLFHKTSSGWGSVVTAEPLVSQESGFRLIADVTLVTNTPLGGLCFHNGTDGFDVLLDARTGTGSTASLQLRKNSLASGAVGLATGLPVTSGVVYTLQVDVKGSDLYIKVTDGSTVITEMTYTVTMPGFTGINRVGFTGNGNVKFENIQLEREAVVPVRAPDSSDVLYGGERITRYRWEVLEHANGIDHLVGTLDGVSDGSLSWIQNAAVKGGGKAVVIDLDVAQRGMLRVADLSLESVRLRPVCVIDGLPENPLGVFLVTGAKEEWEATGRVWTLELLDKCTVPQQDAFENSYAVAAGTPILSKVKEILATAGEYIEVDASNALATRSGMVWEAGTSKLKIINDLLDSAGYSALWMDGYGNFQATPRVLPADRAITYEVLGIPRELTDGANSIYRPDWTRDRDSFDVPNKVIAVQAAGGEDEGALVGVWTNEDPGSPYSYQARGRWIPHVLDSVDTPEGTDAEIIAFLQKRAQTTLIQMSSVQAQAKIEHLPIPVSVGDVLRFAHSRAGIDSRHVITRLDLDTTPTGLMKSTLQEVISL